MPQPSPLPPSLANKPARILAYRVNRRALGEGSLLPEELPHDAFDHFVRMLAPGYKVVTTGRGRDRVWRVGGIEIDQDNEILTGKLGWYSLDPEIVPTWSPELNDWPPTVRDPAETLMPFAFDGSTRLLGVVHGKRSNPQVIATVFELILSENERELARPTTEWSVEPLLDSTEFIEWLNSQDVVQSVAFKVRLPNQEARSAFEELAGRLMRVHGTEYSARLNSKRDEGLQHVEEDPEFSQAISMGRHGYADLRGRGRAGGKQTRYIQGEHVAAEPITRLPATWEETRTLLIDVIRHRLRRFLLDEDEAA